jgi:hypothetical protein
MPTIHNDKRLFRVTAITAVIEATHGTAPVPVELLRGAEFFRDLADASEHGELWVPASDAEIGKHMAAQHIEVAG